MGGLLLKTWNLPEKRIPTNEYNIIKNELVRKLRSDSESLRWVFVDVAPSIRNKETHGDLDIIVGQYSNPNICMLGRNEQDFSKYIESEFGYKPFKNSNVFSFPYKGFQIDVTLYSSNDFFMAVDYSSWGDLGNIMGRVFHKMGLHFGHSGLSFWIRQGLFDNNLQWSDSDHIYDKVVLTRDMKEICEIAGFDYNCWKRGFDTEKEAFDFVIDSKYFNKELFLLENLNHINRTRNRKRGMYKRFVEYVSDSNKVGEPFRSKHEYSLLMQCKYPQLQRTVDSFRLLYEVNKVVKEKVNGKLVMEWCNLTEKDGRLVGKIMSEVRDFPKHVLLLMSQEEIKKKVVDIFANLVIKEE
jgi:hypothetical protein